MAAAGSADDYWVGGLFTFTSGPNAGISRDIKSSTSAGLFTFWEPLPYEILVNDAYSVVPGCAKDVPACKGYSNIVNFGGFPHLRGMPELLRGPQ